MYYFIVNKQGGSGRAARRWRKVRRILAKRNISYKAYETKGPGHAEKLARRIGALPDPDIRLMVAGGDGTINEVLNGISDFERVRLGVIPIGSANDFAGGLGIPKDPEEALLRVLSRDTERRLDVGRVTAENGTDRLFGISSGIGLDAIVCKKVQASAQKKLLNKLHLGSLAYVIMTVQTLFTMKKYHVKVKTAEGEKVFQDMIFLAGMNLPAEGGGVPMCPEASPLDGRISFCTADGVSRPRSFLLLADLIRAKHKGKRGFTLFDAEAIMLEAEEPMVLHADGEYLGDVKKVNMEVLPGRLRLLGD